jgi:hypothetical protein
VDEGAYGILLDQTNNEIFLTDREGAANVFARNANGNAAPLRRIAGHLPMTLG